MARISFNVLDGSDAGRAFSNLPTPVSIGREEGNTVRLNDERISRFHLKVQEDDGHVVLTDLDSTNGTRVNGENVRVSLLRPGDQIRVGATLLVYGNPEEILARMQRIARAGATPSPDADDPTASDGPVAGAPRRPGSQATGEARRGRGDDAPSDAPSKESSIAKTLMNRDGRAPCPSSQPPTIANDEVWCQPPALPDHLTLAQAAQLTELLSALHRRLRAVIDTVSIDGAAGSIRASLPAWQRVLSLQMDLARMIREIADPDFQDL